MNPFISFCLYVSARVFVQYLKSRPDDSQTADSLRFLLSAMNALKRRNPLTESFLVQLDVDLEALGVRIPKLRSAFPRSSDTVSFTISTLLKSFTDALNQPGSPGPRPPGHGCQNPLQQPKKAHGLMNYSNQCHYMKVAGDDGSPANGPELVDIDPSANPQNFSPSEQPTALPTRERSHTGSYLHGHGLIPASFPTYVPPPDMDTVSTNDMSGTSPDGQSNRPTPGSSTTGTASSDQRQNLAAPSHGHLNGGSGRNSFETSPVPSHQNLGGISGTTPGDVVEGNAGAFFGDPSPFGMAAGVAAGLASGQRFGIPGAGDTAAAGAGSAGDFGAWSEIGGQQGMTPGTEGVLRMMAMEGWDMTQ